MTPRQLVCGLAVMIAACIGGEASRPPPFLRSPGVTPGSRQLVLVSGTPGPWGLHVEGDRLVVTKEVLRGNDLVVNGLRFPMRWDVSAQHFKERAARRVDVVVGGLPSGAASSAHRAVSYSAFAIARLVRVRGEAQDSLGFLAFARSVCSSSSIGRYLA